MGIVFKYVRKVQFTTRTTDRSVPAPLGAASEWAMTAAHSTARNPARRATIPPFLLPFRAELMLQSMCCSARASSPSYTRIAIDLSMEYCLSCLMFPRFRAPETMTAAEVIGRANSRGVLYQSAPGVPRQDSNLDIRIGPAWACRRDTRYATASSSGSESSRGSTSSAPTGVSRVSGKGRGSRAAKRPARDRIGLRLDGKR